MLPCERCGLQSLDRRTFASQTHFCIKGKGLVNCVYMPYQLHCTVWSIHAAVLWHMTHYVSIAITMTKTQDIFTTAGAIKTHQLYF